ncbi:MAG TPA: hypothetical protein VM869_18990 [Enhygromyxa sp.]|nr:hypothetical protein [Enhygromyxa sp.]
MSNERSDDNSSNPEDFVTLDRDAVEDLQSRFGADMRIRSRGGPISRVIEAAAPKRPVTPPPPKPQKYGRDNYDRDEYDRDNDYDRDQPGRYDRDGYDRDEYDRDNYDRDQPGHYDRD